MKRALGLAATLVVGLAGTCLAGAMYRNDSGAVAQAVRIEFSEPAEITSMWPDFPQRDPQGPATVIVLSGGEVAAGGWFSFTWRPDSARVVKIEWLSQLPSRAVPNHRPEFDALIGLSFSRSEADGGSAEDRIPNLGLHEPALQEAYTTFLELLLRNTGKEAGVVFAERLYIGPSDRLHRGWGASVSVYLGGEPAQMVGWAREVLAEINRALGVEYFRFTHRRTEAQWLFDFSLAHYLMDRSLVSDVALKPDLSPSLCTFRVSGIYRYENDFKSTLRRAIVEVSLLFRGADERLLCHHGFDASGFPVTSFPRDFANMVLVLSRLETGRDFSHDRNVVNRSPVPVISDIRRALVGETVVLDASASYDPDGEVTTYSWRQIFADKEGTEYRTNHAVELGSPVEPAVSFVPRWPGRYWFEVRVEDDHGATSTALVAVDVRQPEPPFEIRGMAAFAYLDVAGFDTFIPERLRELVEDLGAEWVEFSPYWWMEDEHSNSVHPLGPWHPGAPGFTVPDDALIRFIEMCHAQGLKVFLRPTLEFYNWTDWRGTLQPTDWDAWFDSYTRFVVHYATIAERAGVEMFAVGAELKNSTPFTSHWREVIRQVREVYRGQITYYDSELVHGISGVRFWDQLDLISCGGYPYITGSGPYWDTGYHATNDPPYEVFVDSIRRAFRQHVLPVAQAYGMPVLVAELACGNYDGANLCAWCYDFTGKTVDHNEQTMLFEAHFQVLSGEPWVIGVFPFAWSMKADYNYQNEDWPLGNDLRLKPAAGVVAAWYLPADD